MKKFSDLLREARVQARLTQKELADQVNVDPSYISKIERGIYVPPSRDKVLAIADVLGINGRDKRAYFALSAGYAPDTLEGLNATQKQETHTKEDTPFSAGAFYFPDTYQLEEERIVEEIRQLLQNPRLSDKQREEYIEILRSFLDWLEFRMEVSNDK